MEAYDSLPYIDAEISQAEREVANKVLQRELAHDITTRPHPSLQPLAEPRWSEIVQNELARCAQGQPIQKAIDMSRYEAPEAPSNDDVEMWKSALRNAHASSTYLSGRRQNLQLLEESGKNAWLIGNYQTADMLKRLGQELEVVKTETETVNKARKAAQEGSRGELQALDETWKKGISKIIEVQIAKDELRHELNSRRSAGAG